RGSAWWPRVQCWSQNLAIARTIAQLSPEVARPAPRGCVQSSEIDRRSATEAMRDFRNALRARP
ncbi:MAG TPA: hypothetical protein VF516_10455, partial [Kofleriaceae bacterium]